MAILISAKRPKAKVIVEYNIVEIREDVSIATIYRIN